MTVYAFTGASSVWWVVDQAARYGPRWDLVPPLMLAAASFLGALNGWLDRAQARRHTEAEHKARMRVFSPGSEQLN